MNPDNSTTVAGGALGLHYLSTVNFAALPSWAEFAKLGVAFVLIGVGYFMYRQPKSVSPDQSTVAILDSPVKAQ